MTAALQRRATYAALLELPENVVGEIVNGTVIATPRPASRHARASSRLGVRLGGAFDSDDGNPGGWLVDPIEQTLESFRRDGAHWTLLGAWSGAARVATEPFESYTLDLASLWAR